MKEQLEPSADLSVITDSAWFINFRGMVEGKFSEQQEEFFHKDKHLPCTETEDLTKCVFAEAILSNGFFPDDVPVMMIFSVYDLYLLSTFLGNTTNAGVISLMRVVSEYSGSMISSLYNTINHHQQLSFYVSSCFQHVYFANSALWGPDALLGQEIIDETVINNRFV